MTFLRISRGSRGLQARRRGQSAVARYALGSGIQFDRSMDVSRFHRNRPQLRATGGMAISSANVKLLATQTLYVFVRGKYCCWDSSAGTDLKLESTSPGIHMVNVMDEFVIDLSKLTDAERVARCRKAAAQAEAFAKSVSPDLQEGYRNLAANGTGWRTKSKRDSHNAGPVRPATEFRRVVR